MPFSIQYLMKKSNLPGPRGNLGLLHEFIHNASVSEVSECLSYCKDGVKNSPEEFVAMCGVAGLCFTSRGNIRKALKLVRPYASHSSWRVRESVAIGIQEMAVEEDMEKVIDGLEGWAGGNPLEQRAAAAALCEPKLLRNKRTVGRVLRLLEKMTEGFKTLTGKLTDDRKVLRQALGYCWSVAVAADMEKGKACMEKIAVSKNEHLSWIMIENLKKNRLAAKDPAWVGRMKKL